ncbi:MAG: FtsX-like permease family protein [Betaproteobacteria bacterium]|nr:FtsX-like permease family protein [Betaproteobacteria bacterium]
MFAFALRLLAREWRSGELRVLGLGLLIAVGSLTTVAFFSERVRLVLTQEAAQLLGADLLVVSGRPLDATMQNRARELGLRAMNVVRFPSMAQHDNQTLLADIKAITNSYPLKGKFTVKRDAGLPAIRPTAAPTTGTLWGDERALARLGASVGETITLGDRNFTLIGIIADDPDTAISFMNLGPRIVMNLEDLPSTGLIQAGSRVSYRLGVAGPAGAVEAFRSYAKSKIVAGQRVEDVREARPEIRSALERAEKFLGLASLMSAVIAAVAIALAARRYLVRHLDSCAVMRCFGASQWFILAVHALQFLALALIASAMGCALGYLAQEGLALLMAPVVGVPLPQAGWMPVAQGMAAGVVLLAGFAIPPLVGLRKVPTLRVLRRDMGLPDTITASTYVLGLSALCALVLWQSQDFKLGLYVLLGIAGVIVMASLATWAAMGVLTRAGRRGSFAVRFGISNLHRRPLGSITQVVALGVGMMALILMTMTRADLLESWKRSLPADAPNRFLVNVQPDQVAAIGKFLRGEGMAAPALYPMVRGRLVGINGREVSSENYTEDRAKRLMDREFNLSWSASLPQDNAIVSGNWFSGSDNGRAQFSVEDGLAITLNIQLGDVLAYDIAGVRLEAKVTSLRKVEWDSFRVNFFVITPPGVLETHPASYVSAFHVPAARSALMDRMVKRFPNILVIDVETVLAQVQRIMDQVAKAVEFVFGFGLAAGLIVLFAAIHATHDERIYDAAVLRTVGATTRQLRAAQAAEFAVIGALSGALAALGASAVGYFIAERVLNVSFHANPWIWLVGLLSGAVGVMGVGLAGTYRIARTPPMEIFRTV